MPKFTDDTIFEIFGHEAAEDENDDRFLQYFYFNTAYENLTSNLPLRILVGHKGVGKSALIRRAYLADSSANRLAVILQPSAIMALRQEPDSDNFHRLIEDWKRGIVKLIAETALRNTFQRASETDISLPKNSLISNVTETISDAFRKLSEKYGLGGYDRKIIETFYADKKINVYIDDIDRGWTASRKDIVNISALLNSVRDFNRTNKNIKFRIGLRSDVYYLVRTSDESTDKIEGNVIWMRWSGHEILCLMAQRISSYFHDESYSQSELYKKEQSWITSNILSKVITPSFHGLGHWENRPIHNVLLSLTRSRPRDLVKLFHGAARNAYRSNQEIITTKNLQDSFESYSNERLQDIINEFKSELPSIEMLLKSMKPNKKERRTSFGYLYTMAGLSTKINNIRGNINFNFTNGHQISTKSIIQFLYKIDFITARKDTEQGIERKYFDQSRFLAGEVVDYGFSWEIHPAYRWALQPADVGKVLDSID